MIKCTINGKEVEVKEGSTIIEAYYKLNEEIAHYCYHPGLSVAGVCRLCMCEIEGNPRLQIACNTQVTAGMKINTTSEKVKDAVKWGLDFHLINHPLDCPICDQAGECGLQDQYMRFGKYDSEMAERKVKKHKVVDLGPRVVLDTERCILCSRCVRFTDEVTKTSELGIFNRGDRAEVGTVENKPLNNNYATNVVDICPVGALTSKDFRFRQRVWLLKDFETICTGCSTGCNVTAYYNREGLFRIKPRFNDEVNGHWMCDVGRDMYKFVNLEFRLLDARVSNQGMAEHILPLHAAKKAGEELRKSAENPSQVALVVTGQHSVEELESIVGYFKNELKVDQIYHWLNSPEKFEEFDGLLLRGDKNPNTKGALEVLAKHQISQTFNQLESKLQAGSIDTLVVVGPEDQAVYKDMDQRILLFSKAKNLVWLTACKNGQLDMLNGRVTQIPLKAFVERSGTYVNFKGIRQTAKKGMTVVANALSVDQVTAGFRGENLQVREESSLQGRINNEFTRQQGAL